ncbi:MAG: TraR/DksA family transcriptional regulator [Planctomycetota bacterium]
MLLQKRRDLLGDMSGIEAVALRRNRQDGSGDLSNLPTHMADVGSDNYEQEFTLGLLESERALLDEIDEALQRIENKTFGICLGTGEPIGKARLRARPWAKFCIDYARKLEKGLVRRDEDREAELAGFAEPNEEVEEEFDEELDEELDDEE